MLNKWKSLDLNEKTGIILKILLVLSLIPMMYISRYAFMGADDYDYSIETAHAWINSHSVIQVLLTEIRLFITTYENWQGSYTCIVFSSLHPCIFGSGEHLYWLNCILLMLCLCGGIFYAFRVIIGDVYNRKDVADIASCIAALICLETLPHANQAFYWWNGAVNYVPFFSMLIVQAANYYKTIHEDRCSIKRCIALCVLGFIAAGGNYVMSLLCVEITVLYFLCTIYMSHKLIFKSFSVMAVSFIGLALSLLSPGNTVRIDSYSEDPMGVFETVKRAIDYGIGFVRDSNGILIILCILFLIPFFAQIEVKNENSKLDKINLAATAVLFVLILASSFAPTLYIERSEGPRRAQNARYFYYIFEAVVFELLVVLKTKVFLQRNEKLKDAAESLRAEWKTISARMLMTIGALIAVMVLFYTVPSSNRSYFTSMNALKVLRSGDAVRYSEEVRNRYELLHHDEKDVVLPAYTYKPSLVYFDQWDITEDPEDWRNISLSQFYYKDTIVLEKNK